MRTQTELQIGQVASNAIEFILFVLVLFPTVRAYNQHMSISTLIQYCNSTANPVMGCSGCELASRTGGVCYAYQLTLIKSLSSNPGWPRDFFIPVLFEGRMEKAARWPDLTGIIFPDKPWLAGYPRIIFISDMGDALSETECILPNGERSKGVPFWFLEQEIIANVDSERGRRHVWIWLTKRPHRMAEFSRWLSRPWPQNLWVGTSITHNGNLNRIADLLEVGGDDTVRYLSIEPQWEEVSIVQHLAGGKLHWVIAGGESKQPKQPTHPFDLSWARKLRDECAENGVAFFLKQLGGNVKVGGVDAPAFARDGHGGDWDFWPTDLRVRQLPRIDEDGVVIAEQKKEPRRSKRFPMRIRTLDLPAIREVIRVLEAASARDEVRSKLAERFDVPPNTIDWCAANRTMARQRGENWPFTEPS